MTREELTRKKFKELFAAEPVKNEGSDPEFMRILQRFIFGEVCMSGPLDDEMRELITVTVLAVNQTLPQLKAHVSASLNINISPLKIREAIYQCAPFIGFPKTLNAINAMNESFKERKIELPLENAGCVSEEDRLEKGLNLQLPVYGGEISEQYKWLKEKYKIDISKWLTELFFGDFFSRKGLGEKERELLTVVMLSALGGAEVQVRSHITGALKRGIAKEEIICALAQAMPYMGMPRFFNAINCSKDILE